MLTTRLHHVTIEWYDFGPQWESVAENGHFAIMREIKDGKVRVIVVGVSSDEAYEMRHYSSQGRRANRGRGGCKTARNTGKEYAMNSGAERR